MKKSTKDKAKITLLNPNVDVSINLTYKVKTERGEAFKRWTNRMIKKHQYKALLDILNKNFGGK